MRWLFGHCGDNAACEGTLVAFKRERICRKSYLAMGAARAGALD